MDVVYPYKARPHDIELRFSLRSLSHIRHKKVIIAGDKPKCISDHVRYVPVAPIANRYQSSTANILAAAEEAVTSKRFVVMHDDIFILKPWKFRHENRGTIEEYLATGLPQGVYRQYIELTRDILLVHGVKDPLWFGLHTPTVYERSRLVDLIRDFEGDRYLLRTLYHNLFPQPSTRREDVKKHNWTGCPSADDVLSIGDKVAWMPGFRRWILKQFPRPCIYETGSCSAGLHRRAKCESSAFQSRS